LFAKSKSVIDAEGIPRFFIKALTDLEDFTREVSHTHLITVTTSPTYQLWEDKDAKQKLNKINSKALTTLRQKIRKYNLDFKDNILEYREV